ncbi:MAG: Wzz/FepE/Etk N-terminal domain-containing protein [Deltaproteobacteria bacterium]|nr:Wzz/FepE/Etk N-terminal domain-containing protein [Deltaproteobacteria bacterium]
MSAENEINIIECFRVIWKRKALILIFTFACTFAAAVISLFMEDVYRATAVLTPVNGKDKIGGELSIIAQQIGGLSGITLPSSGSSSEIISLLNSNILREKVIKNHDLLPILFPGQWDKGTKAWKAPERAFLSRDAIIETAAALIKGRQRHDGGDGPTLWNGIRRLNEITRVNTNIKENTITLSIEFHDPELAAKIVEYYLNTLTLHMSNEAKRVAEVNRRYLIEQLGSSADPIIRQKIYNLIAQQVEVFMMSEVKENFAFKVIDPPRASDMRVRPRRARLAELAFIASLLLSSFGAFVIDYIERHVKKDAGTEALQEKKACEGGSNEPPCNKLRNNEDLSAEKVSKQASGN